MILILAFHIFIQIKIVIVSNHLQNFYFVTIVLDRVINVFFFILYQNSINVVYLILEVNHILHIPNTFFLGISLNYGTLNIF